jgi:hypothetical protein
LQAANIFMPAGLIALFWPLTSASLFLILYACTAVYFSGVMVSPLFANVFSQALNRNPACGLCWIFPCGALSSGFW